MKKLLSLMLAMLMLAMPVLSGAEGLTAAATIPMERLADKDFTTKYVLQGQEETVDVTLELSDMLFAAAQLPDEMAGAVKDLLGMITFRSTFQTAEGQAQAGAALLLDGGEAVDVKIAYGDKGIFASSNLLGDKIFQVTGSQLKELAKMGLDRLVAEGRISQELVDSAKRFYGEFRKDPLAAMMKLIGEPDIQPLMDALQGVMAGIRMEEVTEAPEAFPAAVGVVIIPVTKEGLTGVTTELAKLIWSLPVVKKLAEVAGKNPTEEGVVAIFNKVPNALAEDTEVRIYMDETSMNYYITGDVKVSKGGTVRAISYNHLIEIQDAGAHMDMQVSADSGEKIGCVMDVTVTENEASLKYHITSEDMLNGVAYQPVEEIIDMTVTKGENTQDIDMDITMRVKENPDAEQVGITMKTVATEADLGDHAEGSGTFTMALEGLGDLMTLRITEKTDVAEAYIITPDAVQPMAMNEEELNALTQEISTNAMMVVFSLLPKLPSSLQQMFMGQ